MRVFPVFGRYEDGVDLTKKKLIEVALPLDAINAQSAREKSIRHGHPSTLHLWWARRPLATARAVLFAQLVDDPSAREDEFRDEARQRDERDVDSYVEQRAEAERERLFDLITRMVNWDNLGDERLFDAVRKEIDRSTGGNPPAILDPFAGGGTIPLEAQRLGLEAHASDLNPVAVLINKALIEIPPKFADRAPVFPDAAGERTDWPKAVGLAEDVRRYGAWMRDEAEQRIGHLYPKATLDDGNEANVIAWIWARTVTCPNPACGIEMPLVRSWWLGKKKGKEAYVVPTVVDGRVEYSIGHDRAAAPTEGTVKGGKGICIACATLVPNQHIRLEATSQGLGTRLIAVVAEGNRRRVYSAPTLQHESLALSVVRPANTPNQQIPTRNHDVDRLPMYGMPTWSDAFTARQLTALTTFSDLVGEARDRVLRDALAAGMPEGERLEVGGTDAAAYADAVATYLGMVVSRVTDYSSSLASWSSHPKNEVIVNVFRRQAIPMVWDYAEGNLLTDATGSFSAMRAAVARTVESALAVNGAPGIVEQKDAASRNYQNKLISTDPPYYDNIGYSDLSDYFYVWLRRSLRAILPKTFNTMLVPKDEELVANPYRHGGKDGARAFFEHGFEDVFRRARETANPEYPIAVYYAFKQSEIDVTGQASTGWETILGSMIRTGWTITATWPMRTESAGRMIGVGTNALASSIVLALRPRPESAPPIDRRSFSAELRSTLPEALRALQQGSVAPVDLAQAAIGPGMAVYSKYSEVIESDGTSMPVREALRQINAVLDEVVSEQESEFDADTRWCIAWYESHGFDEALYGEAETLANAKNASIDGLRRGGVLRSGGGKVALLAPGELPDGYDPAKDDRISLWEVVLHLARVLDDERGGLDSAGRILQRAEARGIDGSAAHQLSYLLHQISEKKGRTAAQILFNDVAASWPEIRAAARAAERETAPAAVSAQLDFDSLEEV